MIYDLLRNNIDWKLFFLSSSKIFFNKNLNFNNEEEENLYSLIRKICFSLNPQISFDGNITFNPLLILNGEVSGSIEEISEEDFNLLKSLELNQLPINIYTRIADFLWTQKKEFCYGQQALDGYIEWLELFTQKDDYLLADDCLETFLLILRRSLNLSRQLNHKKERRQIGDLAYSQFLKLDGSKLDVYFLDLVEILIREKRGNPDKIINSLNGFILNTFTILPPKVIDKAYRILGNCFKDWKKDLEAYKNTIKALAQFYEKLAEESHENTLPFLAYKENYLLCALSIYRKISDDEGEANVKEKLTLIGENWSTSFRNIPIDNFLKNWMMYLSSNMSQYSFQEILLFLTSFHELAFSKKEAIEKEVVHLSRTLAGRYFPPLVKDSSGKTIFQLQHLDIENPKGNLKLFENYMYFQLSQNAQFKGDLYLRPFFQMLRDKYNFELSDLDFLIESNPLIPKGRENIFKKGLYLALKGDCYAALSILAPQLENLFRNLAGISKAKTITIQDDGAFKAKSLDSIFKLLEEEKFLTEDILFVFKGLLTKTCGANLRNRVAHGLLTSQEAESGASYYLIWIIIYLFSLISFFSFKIPIYFLIKNPEKLYRNFFI